MHIDIINTHRGIHHRESVLVHHTHNNVMYNSNMDSNINNKNSYKIIKG